MPSEQCFTCPQDGRVFKTRPALAQHMRASHKAAPKKPVPKVRARQRLNQNSPGRVVTGRDVIGTYSATASDDAGKILAQFTVNPGMFRTSRLTQESSLWTKWRPLMLRIEVTPSAGGMVTGSYGLGWSADSSDPYEDGQTSINRVGALVPTTTGHISKGISINIPCNISQKWLYVNSKEPDDSLHGKVILLTTSQIGAVTSGSAISFNVVLKWRVAFDNPRMAAASTKIAVYADSDYAGYHTTSTNDWANGAKLSLKAHAGGGLVPFPSSRPQTVYELDSAAKLNYKIKDKPDGVIKYGVQIPNFAVPAFAVFADKAYAQKFAETGNTTYCLKYESAGDAISPDNPAWFQVTSLSEVRESAALKDKVRALEAEVLRLRLLAEEQPSTSGASSEHSFLELLPDQADPPT